MQDAIRCFIEGFINLPLINPGGIADTKNSHMDCINGVNVVGARNVLPVIGETLCVSSGGYPVANVHEVMDAFKKILGEPVMTNFFVHIKQEVRPELLREVSFLGISAQGYSRFSLPESMLENENWGLIDQIKEERGEPADGVWSFSIFHYWEPGKVPISFFPKSPPGSS